MCQATAYLGDVKIMEDVIWVEPTAEGILMRTLFGEEKMVQGSLRGMDLLRHRVLLVPPGSAPTENKVKEARA